MSKILFIFEFMRSMFESFSSFIRWIWTTEFFILVSLLLRELYFKLCWDLFEKFLDSYGG